MGAGDRYAYVGNNPTNSIDPSGHVRCDADGFCGDQADVGKKPLDPLHYFLSKMVMPTDGGTVTTKFGALNTVYGSSEDYDAAYNDPEIGAHAGVDISGAESNDIFAVYDGVVVAALGDDGNYNGGNRIVIEHTVKGEKFYSYYYHLKDDPTDMLGADVSAGDVIGTMGQSGTGSVHLHFEVRTQTGYEAGKSWNKGSYWANSAEEFQQNWVDISSLFGGYDDHLPKDWY